MALMQKNPFETPEAIEAAFYDALEHADLDALMALWSEDEDIVYVPPGGPRLIGHAAVREAWRETFSNGPVHVRPGQGHAIHGGMVSIHSVIEQVMVNHEGQATVINLVASNVFIKGSRGWRLVLHHASPAPQVNAPHDAANEGFLH